MSDDRKVRIECYDLPNLCGFWLEPKEVLDSRREETPEENPLPKVSMFFGEDIMVLAHGQIHPETETPEVNTIELLYRIEGPSLFVRMGPEQRRGAPDDDSNKEFEWTWAFFTDGLLSYTSHNNAMSFFFPATIEEIIDAGYDVEMIRHWAEPIFERGEDVMELISEEWIEDAIARKLREQEEGIR